MIGQDKSNIEHTAGRNSAHTWALRSQAYDFFNRKYEELKIAATHRKQTTAPLFNRQLDPVFLVSPPAEPAHKQAGIYPHARAASGPHLDTSYGSQLTSQPAEAPALRPPRSWWTVAKAGHSFSTRHILEVEFAATHTGIRTSYFLLVTLSPLVSIPSRQVWHNQVAVTGRGIIWRCSSTKRIRFVRQSCIPLSRAHWSYCASES